MRQKLSIQKALDPSMLRCTMPRFSRSRARSNSDESKFSPSLPSLRTYERYQSSSIHRSHLSM